jgi:DNA repair protein RadD
MTAPVAAEPQALRPYQTAAVEGVRRAYGSGAESVVFVLPTGGGKTVIFVFIVDNAVALGRRVLVIAHGQEIVDQISAALTLASIAHGLIAPGHQETEDSVQLASVASLARQRRLRRWAGKFDFVVIDECHHAVSPTWARVLASQPGAKILGVTATAERLDGRGLGEIFDVMVEGPPTAELIAAGWLSKFVVFEPVGGGPDLSGARIRAGDFSIEDQRAAMNHVVIGAAVVEYQRICPGVPAVCYCVDIQHSMAVAERFCAAGIKAVHLDGQTAAEERRAAIAALGKGDLQVIANCGLISEGVDVPSIEAIILLRPTASLALYLQQVGRGLRPGKERALILDFAGNTARHGMPDSPREWSLDAKPRRQREGPEAQRLRRCPTCTALNQPSAHSCANCGGDLRTPKERREVEMALRLAEQREVEATVRLMSYGARLAWARGDEQRLRFVERICGYKRGWAWHRLRELAEQSGERVRA